MSFYEYMVLPAPRDAPRVKGVKGTEARFAQAMVDLLNRHGRDGWEFRRTETMTAEARHGLFARRRAETVTLLVFRRWIGTEPAAEWRDTPEPAEAEPHPAGRRHGAESRPGRLTAARGTAPELALRPIPGPGRG